MERGDEGCSCCTDSQPAQPGLAPPGQRPGSEPDGSDRAAAGPADQTSPPRAGSGRRPGSRALRVKRIAWLRPRRGRRCDPGCRVQRPTGARRSRRGPPRAETTILLRRSRKFGRGHCSRKQVRPSHPSKPHIPRDMGVGGGSRKLAGRGRGREEVPRSGAAVHRQMGCVCVGVCVCEDKTPAGSHCHPRTSA